MVISRRAKIGLWASAIVLVGGGFFLYSQKRAETDYYAELEEGVKIGLPLDPNAYQVRIPDSENAVPIYLSAFEDFQTLGKRFPTERERIEKVVDIAKFPVNTVETDLRHLEGVFAKLDQAAKKRGVCQKIDYSDIFRMDEAGNHMFNKFLTIRIFRAKFFAARGEFDHAIAELAQTGAMAKQLSYDNPTFIGMLCSVRIRTGICRCLGQMLEVRGRNPDTLERVQQVLDSMGAMPSYKRALRGEYAKMLGLVNYINRIDTVEWSSNDIWKEIQSVDFHNGYQLIPALRFQETKRIIRQSRNDFVQMPEDQSDTVSFLKVADELDRENAKSTGRGSVPGNDEIHGLTTKLIVAEIARERLLRILGASLSQKAGFTIPPGCAIDPFTGQPFKTRKSAVGFKVWSVGADRIDNGGIVPSSANKSDLNEIVIGFPTAFKLAGS